MRAHFSGKEYISHNFLLHRFCWEAGPPAPHLGWTRNPQISQGFPHTGALVISTLQLHHQNRKLQPSSVSREKEQACTHTTQETQDYVPTYYNIFTDNCSEWLK